MSHNRKQPSKGKKLQQIRGEIARIELFLFKMNKILEYRPWTVQEQQLAADAMSRHKRLTAQLHGISQPSPRTLRRKQQSRSQTKGYPRTAGSVMTIRNR
ncbi:MULTISPECIES: hypothetical protein [Rhodococcus]|uniref:hypothetical protein n=1 Tax=Rhodococcus TaxID=1827 RepID=UPI000AA9FB88|nr:MULTISPECIES: hypothetical protein [Rhodococcus]WAL49663.1 hypothetical protein OQN32_27000 [Rhodococcus pyridinivorans]